ncbi:MAG: cytochrome c oxidase subunit II [Alphaproteobacteria bacterium]|nr:cytochrome c oxidase subunit II [Alphaproteobacteria bacterium]
MLSRFFAFFACILLLASPAHADDKLALGAPIPWGIDLQEAFSPAKHRMHDFHDFMLVIITVITLFVMCLLIFVILRFNAKANPKPATFAHNTLLEVIWTSIPVLILVVVGIPSMQLLYYVDKTPNPELTLKATAHQWYWSYELPDQKVESFDSRPIWDGTKQTPEQIEAALKDAAPNWIYPTEHPLRLLEVDNRLVLPVDTQVRVYTTSTDVIHSFAVPSLGVRKDGVVGRLNETWLQIDKEGVYYGQCSQICGTGHAFMPIVIEAVSKEKFAQWVAKKTGAAAPAETSAPSKKHSQLQRSSIIAQQ